MTICAVVLVAMLAAPALAWDRFIDADRPDVAAPIVPAQAPATPAPAMPVPPPAAEPEIDVLMRQMGAPPEAAMMMKLLTQADVDPLMMMMLMRMMDGGRIDDDLMGMLFFSKMLQAGTSQPAQPATILADDMLLIVEDGVVYKIDVPNMSLAGTVIYRQKAAQANPLATLLPLMMLGRPRAEAQAIPMGEAIEEFEEGAVEVEPPRPVP
ncbi:MAG: hypothetical protein ACE5R4_04960 [Armatimonadota bacterium]